MWLWIVLGVLLSVLAVAVTFIIWALVFALPRELDGLLDLFGLEFIEDEEKSEDQSSEKL